MERSRSIRASALGQPSSTSVRPPTSSCGRPFHRAATSPRSSATPTRWGAMPSPSEAARIRSRSSVVLPAPGGARIRVLYSVPPDQPVRHRAGRPHRLPCHPDRRRGQTAQPPQLPVPDHRRTAQPHPVPPLYGEVAPAELVGHSVEGGPAGQLQKLLQLLPHHRLPSQGALSLRQHRRHGPPPPQPQLLHPGPLLRWEGHGLLPQTQREDPRRLFKSLDLLLFHISYHRPLPYILCGQAVGYDSLAPPSFCDIFRTSFLTSIS